ncbi:MAG: MATE family efflux transporter, partial [Planctomycetota bacterium]|nr:MATE family efflux transporter [Planctomycetota bacterium]
SAAYMYDGFFLGLTDGRTLRRSMAFSLLVVFLPLAWFAVRQGSNAWLWGAMVAFMASRTVTLGIAAERRIAA